MRPNPSDRADPLEDIAERLERATDEYVLAIDANAEAENVYLCAFSTAFLTGAARDVAATIRQKVAEAQVVEQRMAFNLTQAAERRCKAKVDELRNRLSAMQSLARVMGDFR